MNMNMQWRVMCTWCRGKNAEFYADCIQQLLQQQRLCVEQNDEYVEK